MRSPAVVSKPTEPPAAKFVVPSIVARSASERPVPTAKAAPEATDQRPFTFQPGRLVVTGTESTPAFTAVVPA